MKCEHWSMIIESNCHKNESLIKYCQISLHSALRCSQHEFVESILFFSPALSLIYLNLSTSVIVFHVLVARVCFHSAEPQSFTNWEVVSLSVIIIQQGASVSVQTFSWSIFLHMSYWIGYGSFKINLATLFFYVVFNMQSPFWNSPGHH